MNLMLVDYFLRIDLFQPAAVLANNLGVAHFTDIEVFQKIKNIVNSLQAHNCQPALQWCLDNKSKLSRFKSTLEFQLRLQEFIELVKKRDTLGAINYA
mmetsp:Transcript_4677/g.2622  ORF Transcript_4677/g.2622 Transcript_4677/m.2622 type:complete len:98 (-) Transcript_4677:10-303(-)